MGAIAGSVPQKLLVAIHALLNFCYLAQAPSFTNQSLERVTSALKEFHDNKEVSVIPSICQSGVAMQWTADVTEHAHIKEIKVPARSGNNQNYYSQISRHLNRLDKCFHFDLATYIQSCTDSTVGDDETWEDDKEHEPDAETVSITEYTSPTCSITNYFALSEALLQGSILNTLKPYHTFASSTTALHLANKPPLQLSIDEAADQFGLPDLWPAIHDFLTCHENGLVHPLRGTWSQDQDCLLPFDKLQIWYKPLQAHAMPLAPGHLLSIAPAYRHKSDWHHNQMDPLVENDTRNVWWHLDQTDSRQLIEAVFPGNALFATSNKGQTKSMGDILKLFCKKKLYTGTEVKTQKWLPQSKCPSLSSRSKATRERPLAEFFNTLLQCCSKHLLVDKQYHTWSVDSSTTPLKGGDASRKPDLISLLPGGEADWRHLATFGEVKNRSGPDTQKASYIKIAGKMWCLLYAQDSCHSVPCIHMLRPEIFLTIFDCGGLISTSGFDINKSPMDFLRILIGLSTAPRHSLGFDEMIQWVSSLNDPNDQVGQIKKLTILVKSIPHDIELTELIFLSDTLHGRRTTVWGGRTRQAPDLDDEAGGKEREGKGKGMERGRGREKGKEREREKEEKADEVVVKDSWIDPLRKYTEGMILGKLNNEGAAGVPTLVHEQQVKGPLASPKSWPGAKINHSTHNICSLIGRIDKFYYLRVMSRFVTTPVGLPVTDFLCCAELLVAFLNYVLVHKDAIEKAGILHRDISLLNLLIAFRKGDRDNYRELLKGVPLQT
ncbi:hypothetical protein BDN67DRAFT_1014227 [Paxillus ammoniavirescens]|nr:hypothetical protein BDN67DRAFT_1014227 [Paxillus ammoniavirescens]